MSDQEPAKELVMVKAFSADLANMSPEQFGEWVDNLSRDEFFALMHMVDEHKQTGRTFIPREATNLPRFVGPRDKDWVVYSGDGEPPLAEDTYCYVLFPDGGVEGPSRSDAFLWGGEGQAEILAYAIAKALS